MDNLLSNAIKYSPLGKIVQVEVKAEGGQACCLVRDEGPGISVAEQARLFHKGVRLSSVPTGGEPSTGFGLAVAWDLVRKIGGDLRCESKPGSGACFFFFQAEDGIRDVAVTGVQTCALPISEWRSRPPAAPGSRALRSSKMNTRAERFNAAGLGGSASAAASARHARPARRLAGDRKSACRERG